MSSITAGEKDKELKDSNSAHRAFIDMLKDAFEILGGKEWRTNRKMELDQEEGEEEEDDDAWVNRYAKLGASDGPVEEGDNGEEEGPEPSGEENTPTPNKRGKAKGKGKGKKGKKKLVKEQQPEPTFVKTLPLESYKIIDGDGLVTEYLIAIYNIMQEMVDLRW